MSKNFDTVFESFTKSVNKAEELLEDAYSNNNVIKNDILSMTINMLDIQRAFATTYGDRKAVETVDKKIEKLESIYNKSFNLSDDKTYIVSRDELYDNMNTMYERNMVLMSNIYAGYRKMDFSNRQREILSSTNILIGNIADNFLTTQELFVDLYFSADEKPLLLSRIEDKKQILNRSLKHQEASEFDARLNHHRR